MPVIKQIRRLHFTLVELLIVLTIIILIAGVVGINTQKALRDQRFRTEVSEFVDRLKLSQNLMLIADADIHFKIQANEGEKNIKYWIETDKPFSTQFENFIKKVGYLKTIHHASHASGKDGIIDLKFLSGGAIMSSGNIQLASAIEGDRSTILTANVMLHGYPSPIFSTEKRRDEEMQLKGNPDAELTQAMIHEIQMINNAKKISIP